jgi:hypothetical protein
MNDILSDTIINIPDTFYKDIFIRFIKTFDNVLVDFDMTHVSLEDDDYFSINKKWFERYECVPFIMNENVDMILLRNSLEEQFEYLEKAGIGVMDIKVEDLSVIQTKDRKIKMNILFMNTNKLKEFERKDANKLIEFIDTKLS